MRAVIVIPAIFGCLAVLLKIFYALPLSDSLIWYAGVFVYFFIPGNLLLRALKCGRREHIGNFFHSTALGTALMPLLYGVLRRVDAPWTFGDQSAAHACL